MNRLKFLIALFWVAGQSVYSQTTETVEMADALRQSGKIYVVVCVLSIVFLGIVAYLISIDRKLSALEKELKGKA